MFFLEVAESGHQLFSSEGGIFDEVLIFGHMKAGQSASHSEIVATEGGGVGDTTIKARENALVDRAAHDDGGAGDVTTGKGFGQSDDVGIEIPVLEAEPLTRATEGCLNLVGDEERAVLPAEFLGSGEVVVGGILDSFSLDGLKDEGGDLTGLEFLFEIFEISELHKVCTR